MTLARLFDELVSEDDKRAEQLRKPLADLRSEALRLVGARQVVLVSCVSCLAAACACIASSSGSVPPVPIAPSTQTAAAPFVDERIRKLVDEVEKDYNEEEERTSLEKNVQGSRKRKRSETVVYNRELWNAPCPFPTMLTHEVQALCDLSVPVFDQHNFEFPTAVELEMIPPEYRENAKLTNALKNHPFLQPHSDGLWCRSCYECTVTSRDKKVFVTTPLPYSAIEKRLGTKISEHLNTTRQTHQKWWTTWFQDLRTRNAYGAIGQARLMMQQNALRLKKVGRVINTQNFVAICHHIMAAAHHDRSIVRFTQEQQERAALHDQGTRDLLQNAFNLTSDEVINEIFSIMVAHTRTLTRQKIQGSRYVSFMTDECQDLKKRAQYAVFFKVLEGGLITEVFWDLQAKKSADGSAPELFKHLVKMTDALKGVWSKVVGVSTDGANVMKGHLSGTQLLLRSRLCPYALWIWCQGHKLNVLCLRVGKAYADIADVEVFLSAVYRLFYRGRGDGKGKLRTLNECVSAAAKAVDNFGMWRELELCEVGDTRWVSHERAASTVTNVLRGVYQGVSALSEGNEAAREVSEHMQKKGPMFALFLYEVTLPVVAHFSSALQKASSFFAQVVSLKGHYKKKILDIAHEPKQYTKYFNCHMVLNAATTGIFQQPWATHEELTTWHHSVAVPYLKALAKAFDEELGMSACLQAFSLYDPKGPTFANGKIDLVAAKKELGHILAHYSGPHTFKNCSEEKTDIVACGPFLSENRRTALLHELEPFCAEIVRQQWASLEDVMLGLLKSSNLSTAFPETNNLFAIAVVLPMGTASVERVFSNMKRVLTKARKRLHEQTLTDVLMLGLNGPYERGSGIPRSAMEAYLNAWIASPRTLNFATWPERRPGCNAGGLKKRPPPGAQKGLAKYMASSGVRVSPAADPFSDDVQRCFAALETVASSPGGGWGAAASGSGGDEGVAGLVGRLRAAVGEQIREVITHCLIDPGSGEARGGAVQLRVGGGGGGSTVDAAAGRFGGRAADAVNSNTASSTVSNSSVGNANRAPNDPTVAGRTADFVNSSSNKSNANNVSNNSSVHNTKSTACDPFNTSRTTDAVNNSSNNNNNSNNNTTLSASNAASDSSFNNAIRATSGPFSTGGTANSAGSTNDTNRTAGAANNRCGAASAAAADGRRAPFHRRSGSDAAVFAPAPPPAAQECRPGTSGGSSRAAAQRHASKGPEGAERRRSSCCGGAPATDVVQSPGTSTLGNTLGNWTTTARPLSAVELSRGAVMTCLPQARQAQSTPTPRGGVATVRRRSAVDDPSRQAQSTPTHTAAGKGSTAAVRCRSAADDPLQARHPQHTPTPAPGATSEGSAPGRAAATARCRSAANDAGHPQGAAPRLRPATGGRKASVAVSAGAGDPQTVPTSIAGHLHFQLQATCASVHAARVSLWLLDNYGSDPDATSKAWLRCAAAVAADAAGAARHPAPDRDPHPPSAPRPGIAESQLLTKTDGKKQAQSHRPEAPPEASGTVGTDPTQCMLSVSTGLPQKVLASSVAMNFRNVKLSTLFTHDIAQKLGLDTVSLLAFPVFSGGASDAVGVLFAVNKRHLPCFTEDDERVLAAAAALLSHGLLSWFPVSAVHAAQASAAGRQAAAALHLHTHVPPMLPPPVSIDPQEAGSIAELHEGFLSFKKRQIIYRASSRTCAHAKEDANGRAVMMDGSNLVELSHQLKWMETMWRTTLDESTALHTQCRWWQSKLARAQAKVRWLERQMDRATRCPDLATARQMLSEPPDEPQIGEDAMPHGSEGPLHQSRPPAAHVAVRSYTNKPLNGFDDLEKEWLAAYGLPVKSVACQTDERMRAASFSKPKRGPTARRCSSTRSVSRWESSKNRLSTAVFKCSTGEGIFGNDEPEHPHTAGKESTGASPSDTARLMGSRSPSPSVSFADCPRHLEPHSTPPHQGQEVPFSRVDSTLDLAGRLPTPAAAVLADIPDADHRRPVGRPSLRIPFLKHQEAPAAAAVRPASRATVDDLQSIAAVCGVPLAAPSDNILDASYESLTSNRSEVYT
ncbi:hypothetical protein DIPPA_29186 [Diplonema papillatum]|nr:hypothetical protein DIPPA_29186 [Diplonema papillatum]